MRLRNLVFLFCALPVLAHAQPRGLSLEASDASRALQAALSARNTGDWDGALALAQPAGFVGVDLIEWNRLRAGQGSFQDTLAFLDRRADWPGLPLLRKRSEKTIPPGFDAATVVTFFEAQAPRTLIGSLRLAQALRNQGRPDAAQAEIRRGWVEFDASAEVETAVLAEFATDVAPVHSARMESLLWGGHTEAANRLMGRVDALTAKKARARIALQTQSDGVDDLVAAVPAELQKDPGLLHDRFQYRVRKGRWAAAEALILETSASAARLGRPDAWAASRIRLARDRMGDGRHLAAYRLAANHHMTIGSRFAELEFLAGYLALRKLKRPDAAIYHFQRHASAVTSPISLGRTHYWQGRAYEAMQKPDAAKAAFRNGAKYQTSFYGLLSAEKVGLPLDAKLAAGDVFSGALSAPFTKSSVYEAAQILMDAGQMRVGVRFLTHLAESLDRKQIGQMATLAEDAGLPQIALLIGKRGVQYGSLIEQAYYPLHPLVDEVKGIPTEMALAIARRESEFFPDARSGVGALGLMQVMPATAKEVAGNIGLPFDERRLTADPVYNAKIGVGYLQGLYRQFGNSPVQIAAAYNAGPSRPKRWMAERGDPRRGQVDVIDWIEEIPFSETRNYVMRVTEALPIYRARLTGTAGPVDFTKLLVGEYVDAPPAPPPPVRVAPETTMRPVARPAVPATE